MGADNPTFNNHFQTEELNRRKTASDAKNDTDDLTFSNNRIGQTAVSHKGVEEHMDKKRLKEELKEVWDD